MAVDHREIAFETAIEASLLEAGGYDRADPKNFDRERCLDPTILIPFLKETQPTEWAALEKLHGESTEQIVLDDLCKALDAQGMLPVLRRGFKCFGKPLRVAYFAPAACCRDGTARACRRRRVRRRLQASCASAWP